MSKLSENKEGDRQEERQTRRETDTERDRQAERQTSRETDKQRDRQATDAFMNLQRRRRGNSLHRNETQGLIGRGGAGGLAVGHGMEEIAYRYQIFTSVRKSRRCAHGRKYSQFYSQFRALGTQYLWASMIFVLLFRLLCLRYLENEIFVCFSKFLKCRGQSIKYLENTCVEKEGVLSRVWKRRCSVACVA